MNDKPMPALVTPTGRVVPYQPFTPTEETVLTLLGQGKRPSEVASMLRLRLGTVREHIQRMADKIPGDLPPRAKILAWHRGATLQVLTGRSR